MSKLGVIIGLLGGNESSVKAFSQCVGKVIKQLTIDETELLFTFEDETMLKLWDNGQSCCEHRYMHTDDDLSYYVGSKLVSAEVREGPEVESEYDEVKESEFLIIATSKGQFTVVNYNEHNGYYGGFMIVASIVDNIEYTNEE